MPMPMYHRGCGALVLWRLGKSQVRYAPATSANTLRVDGTHPVRGERLACPRCARTVSLGELTNLRTPAEIAGDIWPT